MRYSIADLCDGYEDQIQVLHPDFKSYGGKARLSGQIRTIQVDQNPSENRALLSEKGTGHILVVDAGANTQGAVVGDNLAKIAIENGWQGIIVNGYIRDTSILKALLIGIGALGTCPRRGRNSNRALRTCLKSF